MEALTQDEDGDRKTDACICRTILMPYHTHAVRALKRFKEGVAERPAGVADSMLSVLQRRWTQIEVMVTKVFNDDINPQTKDEFSSLWMPYKIQ